MTATTAATDPVVANELASLKPARRRRVGRAGGINWPATIIMAVLSLTVLVPLYVTIVMALKTSAQSVDGNAFSLPSPINFNSFVQAWTLTDFPRSFSISLFISVISVLGAIILSTLASYAIVRNWDHKLFRYSFFYLLAVMFIPFPVVALTQIKLTAFLSLDNPIGVAILHVMFQISFSVLLCTAFLRSLPAELEEAARIDGCTTNQLFWKVTFPLLAPISATIGIFAFLASWNDYMMPVLITADPQLQTLPVVQQLFQSQFSTNYNVAFASYLLAMAPTIIVYIFAQRWVMSGVTQGAIK
jgi:raffinose/stachyose/melibiose transport system permease protein